jgi:glycosyltransferase involved in cell wall biosynthesis
MPPRVSVVLPTYNRSHLLEKSVRSVLDQTFVDLELIVVDDGSTDGTLDVLKQVDDQRLNVVSLPNNVGGAMARNVGIEVSVGEFVAFQDSDDEWVPHKLRRLVGEMDDKSRLGAVFSSYWRYSEGAKELVPDLDGLTVTENLHKLLLSRNIVGTPTAMVRKEKLIAIDGFDVELPRYQDWDLFLRLSMDNEIGFVREPLVHSFDTGNGISSNWEGMAFALGRMASKNLNYISEDKVLHSLWMYKIGDANLKIGNTARAMLYFAKAVGLKPFSKSLYKRVYNSIKST